MSWATAGGWITLLVWCAGCGRGSADDPRPSADPRPAPAPKHDQPPVAADGAPGATASEPSAEHTAAEGSTQAPPRTTGPQPYRRDGDIVRGVDDFVFWGWSDDGRYFAFETFHHGAQMANCEGEAEMTIVEASTDRYVDDGHVMVRHSDPEADVCDPPDLREELGYRARPRRERLGISAEHLGGPITLTGSGERWSFAVPGGEAPVGVFLRVLHGTDDPVDAADGAAFELKVTPPGGSEIVVEPGLRRRPWTMGYGLERGMAFVGPHGRHVAIMIAQREPMPEGVRTTWMASAVTLP